MIDEKKLIERLEEITEPIRPVGWSRKIEVVETKAVIEIVNQLAEEYNNDVCEWHKVKNGNAYKCNTHAEIHDSRVLDWYVCPYCGKKIKVIGD